MIKDIFYRLKDRRRNSFPEEKQLLINRELFYKQFVKEFDLCFDIGANIGNRIAPLLKMGAQIIAVEPQQYCCDYLKAVYGNRITIVQKGLTDQPGVAELHISDSHTLSSFDQEFIKKIGHNWFENNSWKKKTHVEMDTLDNLIRRYGKPSFIKIDVEGYELQVLKGLSQPINMISFEYSIPFFLDRAIQCIERIALNGNIYCNYSIAEYMVLELEEWETVPDFLQTMHGEKFLEHGFGDIYIKHIP